MKQDATRPFLATINTDRDQKVAQIQADTDTEIKRIYAQAHAAARQLQDETNERLRRELSIRRHKEISRIQARIRHKRWQSLKQLQHSVNQQVLDKLFSAWAEADWQWQWCHFWLQAAFDRDGETALSVAISETVLPETLEKIQAWADQNKLDLSIDQTITELGLVLSWADFKLDGLIHSQEQTIETAVLAHLTPLLPRLHRRGASS